MFSLLKEHCITEIGLSKPPQEKDPGFPALEGHCTFNGGGKSWLVGCTWLYRAATTLLLLPAKPPIALPAFLMSPLLSEDANSQQFSRPI